MEAQAQHTNDEITHVIHKLKVKYDVLQGFGEGAPVSHEAD